MTMKADLVRDLGHRFVYLSLCERNWGTTHARRRADKCAPWIELWYLGLLNDERQARERASAELKKLGVTIRKQHERRQQQPAVAEEEQAA